jgi:hypothetical protein
MMTYYYWESGNDCERRDGNKLIGEWDCMVDRV